MTYDAVIVGASIAGLSAGLHLSRAGWSVCIIDRRHEVGVPVRCGEATGNRAELSRFLDMDPSWIACDITGMAAHVNGSRIAQMSVADTGVMLHRDRFEQGLARLARASGATVMLDTPVTGLFRNGTGWGGVVCENGARIRASYIVGADGAESYVGRWAGMVGPLRPGEIVSAVQYRMQSGFCNDGLLHFFLGRDAIPCGYLWVFPKGNGCVSVGGGMYNRSAGQASVLRYVDRFIESHMGVRPQRETLITGAIPVVLSPRKLTKDNIVLVGDAARQVNPFSAGGIMNALEAADSAARYLVALRSAGTRRSADTYSASWNRRQRRQHKVFLYLREIWFSLADEQLPPLLKTAAAAADGVFDRTKPFRIPVRPFLRFLLAVLPQAVKHVRVLFK